MKSQSGQRKIYVVYNGRVDKPTIYSSWARAHPKVIEFEGAEFKQFDRLEDAQNSIKARGIEEYDKFLKSERDIARSHPRGKYYAVAYGNMIGIFEDWKTAEYSIKEFKSACHQRFDTEHEARNFIKEWKESFAEIWYWKKRKALCDGWIAKSLSPDLETVLMKIDTAIDPDIFFNHSCSS